MAPIDYLHIRFKLAESIWDRMHQVMYLYPVPWMRDDLKEGALREWGELVHGKVSKQFSEVTKKYVGDYMMNGKMPPKEIEAPILNMVDDVAAGRQIQMKAGDYIAIQNFIKAGKGTEL